MGKAGSLMKEKLLEEEATIFVQTFIFCSNKEVVFLIVSAVHFSTNKPNTLI